jgi:1,4-dihydroxy-2-naphthoate octaprenyltransferase
MFGIEFARIEFAGLLVACYLSQLILVIIGWMPPTTLLTLITIPVTMKLVQIFNNETEQKALHQAQGNTAKLHGQIGLLMVIGWIVWLAIQSVIGG